MNRLTTIVLAIGIAIIPAVLTTNLFLNELNKIDAENQCIKELVQSGVERRDIKTSNGKCHVESPL